MPPKNRSLDQILGQRKAAVHTSINCKFGGYDKRIYTLDVDIVFDNLLIVLFFLQAF